MQAFEDVVRQHEAIKQQSTDAPNTVQLEQIMSLLKETRQAGATTSSAQAREDLRDILRYWGQYLNKNYDVYPDMHLAPFDEAQVPQDTAVSNPATLPALPESTQPIRVSSESVNSGFSQLKWVFILMVGMLVLFFVVQVVFPPQRRDDTALTITPDELMIAAVTETHAALAEIETATAVSAQPTSTPAPEIMEVTTMPQPTAAPIFIEHTVAEGDTLFSIARQYNTTVDSIRQANNLTTETITVGDVLEIEVVPTPETAVSTDSSPASDETPQPPASSIPADANAVIRGSSESATTRLLVAPNSTAQEIQAVNAGTFVYAVGQTDDGTWLLLELNGRTVRGWVPAAEVGLLYPLVPQEIPVIQTQ